MRCKICDWSPDGVQSTYHVGLALPRVSHSTDPETGEISCNCFDGGVDYNYDSISDIGSMEEDGGNPDEL